VKVPAGIARLGPDVAPRVDELVAQAERRQDRELEEALTKTLRIVPGPLRGLVRKVLLG